MPEKRIVNTGIRLVVQTSVTIKANASVAHVNKNKDGDVGKTTKRAVLRLAADGANDTERNYVKSAFQRPKLPPNADIALLCNYFMY